MNLNLNISSILSKLLLLNLTTTLLCLPLTASDTYLKLDNQHVAETHELIADPFLVLRTKPIDSYLETNFLSAWKTYAQLIHPHEDLNHYAQAQMPSLSSAACPPVVVANSIFDHVIPYFCLDVQNAPEKVWWQISPKADFSLIIPNFECIHDFCPSIQLPLLSDTFFNPDTQYYFRVKTYADDAWSGWSAIHSFYVTKPSPVENITFKKISNGSYNLSWQGSKDSQTRYWVFASKSFDFLPSIYCDKHPTAIHQGQIIGYEPNQNLIAQTTECHLAIDDSLPYYRIVAEKQGHFSTPSALIYLSDQDLKLQGDTLQAVEDPALIVRTSIESCPRKVQISQEIWNKVAPYLIPDSHPVKLQLDAIFSSSRAILNMKTLRAAGFHASNPRRFTRLVVATHPAVPGYVFKIYLDAQEYHKNKTEYENWIMRIQGIQAVQKQIEEHGLQNFFRLPTKWIYALPSMPSPPKEFLRKNFILVETDMNIYSNEENLRLWASDQVSQPLLDALFLILKNVGLHDCTKPDNIPFTKDGKVTFIDTQTFNKKPLFKRFKAFLSPANQEYWLQLIEKNK